MATQTSNLGLTKPAYSETADIADINNNMDKIDTAVNGVQNGIAILANGNVHSAVTSGQYVYVRNHGTLAEGLYTATTNISTNATLSTSNLTAVPSNGALNTLRDDVTSLNSNTTTSGIRTEVAQLTTSGTAVNYTASQTGYYTVLASTANTEGSCTAIIQDTSGNTLLRSTATLAKWDNITCGLLPLKAGSTIKAVALFPSGGNGSIIRIS